MTPHNFSKFYTFYFIVFGMLIALSSTAIWYFLEIDHLTQCISDKADTISSYKVKDTLTMEISNIDKVVSLIGTEPITQTFLRTGDDHLQEEIRQWLAVLLHGNKRITKACLIDAKGDELIRMDNDSQTISTKESSLLKNVSEKAYFKTVFSRKENEIWHSRVNLKFGSTMNKLIPTLRVAIPIRYEEKFLGMFIVNIDAQSILGSISQSGFFTHYIIDKDKNYILHPDEKYTLNRYKGVETPFKVDFPHGLKHKDIYTFDLNPILKNEDKALLVLKPKLEYRDYLLHQYLRTTFYVLLIALILSIFMGFYAAKVPKRFHKALMRTQKRLEEFTDILNKYVITAKTKPDSTIIDVSGAFTKSSGYTKEYLIGKKMCIIKHPSQENSLYERLWSTIKTGKSWHGIIKNRKKNGDVFWLEQNIIPMLNEENKIEYYLAVANDITSEKYIEEIAYIDPLTGIYNRRMLFQLTKEQFHLSQRHALPLALLIIDIDHFKNVNDTYGHQVGDKVLVETVKEVSFHIRKSDIFGRYGGEEFMIACPETDEEGAYTLAEKIRRLIATHPFEDIGYKSVSIGIALLKDEKSLDELIKKADKALYKAKESGRNRVIISS